MTCKLTHGAGIKLLSDFGQLGRNRIVLYLSGPVITSTVVRRSASIISEVRSTSSTMVMHEQRGLGCSRPLPQTPKPHQDSAQTSLQHGERRGFSEYYPSASPFDCRTSRNGLVCTMLTQCPFNGPSSREGTVTFHRFGY